jgi:hypothetical protein
MIRIGVALLPLALSPVLAALIGNGTLDLGGGEKDLVWVLIWAGWSVGFGGSSLYLWRRNWPLSRSIRRSVLVGLVGLVAGALLLAAVGQLGVGGRF